MRVLLAVPFLFLAGCADDVTFFDGGDCEVGPTDTFKPGWVGHSVRCTDTPAGATHSFSFDCPKTALVGLRGLEIAAGSLGAVLSQDGEAVLRIEQVRGDIEDWRQVPAGNYTFVVTSSGDFQGGVLFGTGCRL